MLLAPDVLGFRRALCSDKARSSFISGDAVDIVRALIPADPRSNGMGKTAPAKIDYRLLAARGYAPGKDDADIDRVFVRDFVLPVRIGAYAHERNKTQDVRFNVEVRVSRPDRAAADIRDVFSYDLITDSIRMIVADEHIALVEILAERIAHVLLSYPRVTSIAHPERRAVVIVDLGQLAAAVGFVGVRAVRIGNARLVAREVALEDRRRADDAELAANRARSRRACCASRTACARPCPRTCRCGRRCRGR